MDTEAMQNIANAGLHTAGTLAITGMGYNLAKHTIDNTSRMAGRKGKSKLNYSKKMKSMGKMPKKSKGIGSKLSFI